MARVNQGNAEKIKKYFGGAGRMLPWILILIGIPLLFAFLIGVLFIGAGIYMLSQRSAPVEDSKIDTWAREIIAGHDYVARARELSGFTDFVREPILLTGIAGDAMKDGVFNGERVGDDGRYRATPMQATVLLASPDQLGVYQTGIDLITGNRVNERFFEVFYQDVTAITVGSKSQFMDMAIATAATSGAKGLDIQQSLNAAKARENMQKLRSRYGKSIVADILQWESAKVYMIDMTDGQRVPIYVSDDRVTEEANAAPFISGDNTAQAMHALRLFVRDKKRGFLRAEIAG